MFEFPEGARLRVDYSILHQSKVPFKTEPRETTENEWEHMQRTGHRQYFYERIDGYGFWVVTCVCGDQVAARFPALAKYGMDKEPNKERK